MNQPCLFPGDVLRPGAWPFQGLEPMAYDVIMADPPWRFDLWSEKGEAKSAEAQYETMDLEAIRALPVADLARPDCLLWLWATAPLLDKQIGVLERWGFAFVSAGAWHKRRWGTGYVWRNVCEFVLLGTRGRPKVRGASIPNYIDENRRQHSRKPDKAYRMAEAMLPDARRCSLFERPERRGWEGWGDQYGQPIEKRAPRGPTTDHDCGLFAKGDA